MGNVNKTKVGRVCLLDLTTLLGQGTHLCFAQLSNGTSPHSAPENYW